MGRIQECQKIKGTPGKLSTCQDIGARCGEPRGVRKEPPHEGTEEVKS